MRAQTGHSTALRAHRLALEMVLALALGTGAAPLAAQSYPDAEEIVLEDEPDEPVDTSYPTVQSSARTPDHSAWGNVASLYTTPPDLAHCVAGDLRAEAKASFLEAFNALRARHGLAPVGYNAAADRSAAEAALIMAAGSALSHQPPPSWRCWTAAGASAAGSSNLLGGVSSPYLAYEDDNAILAAWLIEGEGDEIGHRRWLLDPYLDQTALGRAIAVLPSGVRVDSVVMKVFDFPRDAASRDRSTRTAPAFVAWPQGDYPRVFFSPRARLSFAVSQDPGNEDAQGTIDYSGTRVSISDGEHILTTHDQLWDNEGYGVANCLSWRVDGLVTGRTYAVSISGIRGAPQDRYSYTFRITD